MGSHGHRQNMPFGYNPNGIHGIGLPAYMNQGQPPPQPGQPLLSEQETEQMQDFFSTFEAENQAHGNPMHGQFADNMAQLQQLQMPNTYVGHEVNMRSPQSAMDWHGQQMNPFQFTHPMNPMAMQTPTSPYGNTNGHMASPVSNMFPMHQNNIQNFNSTWQQAFPTHPMHGSRADVNFGSDPNFLSNGYTAPDGTIDADLSLLTYAMAPASSASNTQPNSRTGSNANTEPSSPVTAKKRKLNTFQSESLRMTPANGMQTNGMTAAQSSAPPASTRKPRKPVVKNEHPPTPLSKTPTINEEDDIQEEDAEYDEEDPDGQPRSPSPPAPWPASKARPVHKEPLPPKPAKPRKQSKSSNSPAKPPKARRASSGVGSNVARTPLTAEQKKANHTNSEQKRRDATARSYAELYDMVPELNDMGKQSTMKKLEVVVDKVHNVKARLEYLRQQLGRDIETGRPLPGTIAQTQYSGDMSHLSGWTMPAQR